MVGEQDDHGCKCCPGPMGQTGPVGPMGPKGDAGGEGPRGPSGPMGSTGATGAPGPAGPMGPQGSAGQSGPMGPHGDVGPQGPQGNEGPIGNQGQMGPQGTQGPQGEQGPKGDCVECECHCPVEFMEVYSVLPQTLIASPGINLEGGTALLENIQVATAVFDVSLAASTGEIKILKKGWYRIYKAVSGSLNPVFSPLKIWTMSLFVNGLIIPPSTFGDMTISPEQHANQTTSVVIILLNAGDVVKLCNTSDAPLFLGTVAAGSNAVPLSADINISLLKDP